MYHVGDFFDTYDSLPGLVQCPFFRFQGSEIRPLQGLIGLNLTVEQRLVKSPGPPAINWEYSAGFLDLKNLHQYMNTPQS